MTHHQLSTSDPWHPLREVTSARIALGRAGGSLPTREWLDFKQAHAAARDAVHTPFDAEGLAEQLQSLGCEVVVISSAASDRATFLKRPDLGRKLDDAAKQIVCQQGTSETNPDLAIVISDGLSATAVHRQAVPLLTLLLPKLQSTQWTVSAIVIVRFGRVAVEDRVGELLGARIALMLIGERPGLGSSDSLGAYFVHSPQSGKTDAQRNCVSNIRPEGLSHPVAAETIHHLLTESRRRRLSGVQLKDERKMNKAVIPSTTSDVKEIA